MNATWASRSGGTILAAVLFLATCGPTPTATALPLSIAVDPAEETVPAGSSATVRLAVSPPFGVPHHFTASGLPPGTGTEFLGGPAPFQSALIVHTPADLAPGRYTFALSVTLPQTPTLTGLATATLSVMACAEFLPGEFTQSMSDRPVTIISQGKPSIEHGLLVPLQVCGPATERALEVTLVSALSEAGTSMATPPPFYVYRSLVWPEPAEAITAAPSYTWARNVALPRIDNAGWRLSGTIAPGLYLLIFERDHWGGPTDPRDVPATVTYRVVLGSNP